MDSTINMLWTVGVVLVAKMTQYPFRTLKLATRQKAALSHHKELLSCY